MNPEISKISSLFLERVPSGRVRERLCVILGAGADLSSGGMTFSQLKKACLERFKYMPAISIMSDADLDYHFNRFLEESQKESQRAAIVSFIFHGFESGKPSDGYKVLVLLAKEGIVDAVVTTNFDDLLEVAQRELKLNIFQIYAPGVASPFLINEQAFIPPKPIYIKVHGDVQAQFITHITKREIQSKQYSKDFSLLLRQIFSSYQLVFVGYGGNDEIFAREVEAASREIVQPVYWCNHSPLEATAPLARALQGVDIRFVRASFEEVFTEGSVECLNAASPLEASVQFVAPLIRERLRQINDDFLHAFSYSSRSDRLKLLIPRKAVMEKIAVFRANSTKPLAVLTGASGAGKSSLIAQLCDSSMYQGSATFIAIRARSIANTDFARDMVERLGYASENPLAVLYHFSGWMRDRNQQLTIAIDALNERPTTSECLVLFREILRVILWFQYHGSIKVLITVRPETWNEIFSFVDLYDLSKVIWGDNDVQFKDKVNAIHLDKFDTDELTAAYNSYAKHYAISTPLRQVDTPSRELLSDPYLLALVMQNRETITSDSLGFDIYHAAHHELLNRSFGHSKAEAVGLSLARLAKLSLEERIVQFSLDDLGVVGLSQEQISTLRELNILSQATPTTTCFSHDRVHESYLVMAITDLSALRILEIDDLLKALEEAVTYPRLYSALRQCLAHPRGNLADHYIHLLFEVLSSCLSNSNFYSSRARNLLYEFAKDTIMAIAANTPDRFGAIAQNFFDRSGDDSRGGIARVLLHASCLLNVDRSLPLMLSAADSSSDLLRVEATILLYDKMVQKLLGAPRSSQASLTTGLFRDFFFGENVEPHLRVLRILGLVAQVGPDNSHPSEWAEISKGISEVFRNACRQQIATERVPSEFTDLVIANANRYLFNAGGEDLLEHYFMSPARKVLLPIFENIDSGLPLEMAHVERMRPFVCELGQTFEFIICNLLFVLSMKARRGETETTFETYFGTFGDHTTPEEIDFFMSALCLSHLALGNSFQEVAARYTERILRGLPQAVHENPGAIRGKRRGRFSDPFDQQFEDGFNPLAFYFYNAPSRRRQTMGYSEYLKTAGPDEDLLLLYWKYLDEFETNNLPVGTSRVIHALGQMISLWPFEGLASIQRLLGRTDSGVRRAIVRVLAEAYARFPGETMLLMAQSGSAFTEDEKFAIKCGIDPRLSERSFEQLHWARVLLFLDRGDQTGRFLNDLARILVSSFSLPEALNAILSRVTKVPAVSF